MPITTTHPAVDSPDLPAGVAVQPRRFQFADLDAVPQYWYLGNPILTHFENAFSILIPPGERFFVRSSGPCAKRVSSAPLGVRAGLAFGAVTSRQGDYFGSSVNLAARLVAIAPRGHILVGEALASRLTPGSWMLGEIQSLDIRGFTEPVPARSLTFAGRRESDAPPCSS